MSALIEKIEDCQSVENLSKKWKEASQNLKEAQSLEESARLELINACGYENYEGYGIKLQLIEKKGSIKYDLIPQLLGINLEKYRKDSVRYWSVKPSVKD